MTRARTARIVVGVAMLIGSSACGGGDGQTAGSSGATASPSAAASASSSPAGDASGTTARAEELCQFLEQEVPKLQAVGSGGTGAAGLANFTGDYSGWIDKDPATRKLDDAQALDTITTASCPEARSEVLAILEAKSFAEAFGG